MADGRSDVEPARILLRQAIADRIFPAAVAEVGDGRSILWREAFGRLSFDDGAPPADPHSIFDLASLTKPVATTTVVMQLVAGRKIDLDEPASGLFPDWRGEDRESVTVRDLLEHSSGLPARLVEAPPATRREFEHDICAMPLEYAPRLQSIYSDLGFILLGFAAEDRGEASLSSQFDAVMLLLKTAADAAAAVQGDDVPMAPERDGVLRFAPLGDAISVAPTIPLDNDIRRGETLVGRVHDNYAAALNGIAGHAGLFGNAAGLGVFARAILRAAHEDKSFFPPFTYSWVMKMARKSKVAGSSRALGWDTMLPTSSCGSGMSFAAIGHVGFTGTSLWIDPVLDRYFILLTNRAAAGGAIDAMRDVRRAFHDALVTID